MIKGYDKNYIRKIKINKIFNLGLTIIPYTTPEYIWKYGGGLMNKYKKPGIYSNSLLPSG